MNLSELLALGDLDNPIEKVEASILGHECVLYVKRPTAMDEAAATADMVHFGILDRDFKVTGKGTTSDLLQISARRIARHLVDEDGDPVLTAEQVLSKKMKWVNAVDSVVSSVVHAKEIKAKDSEKTVNQIEQESIEETAKN